MNKKTLPEETMKMPEENFGSGATERQPSYIGIVLGVLIIVLVIILAGLYMWGEILKKQGEQTMYTDAPEPTAEENRGPESTNSEDETALSTSDEVNAIEADLDNTNLDELDADITAIDAEFDAAASQ